MAKSYPYFLQKGDGFAVFLLVKVVHWFTVPIPRETVKKAPLTWVSLPGPACLLAIADVAHGSDSCDSRDCHKEDTQEPSLQRQHACSHCRILKQKTTHHGSARSWMGYTVTVCYVHTCWHVSNHLCSASPMYHSCVRIIYEFFGHTKHHI